jgi:hypothetical protein
MSDAATPGIYSLTKPVILAHPNLAVARAFGPKGRESGTPKFSANLVLDRDSDDLKALQALAAQVAKAKWPGRPFKDADPKKTIQFPFTNGDKLADKRKAAGKSDGEFQRGKVIIAARSKYAPRLSALQGGKVVDFEDENARKAALPLFYFGAEVLAQLNLVAYDGVGANPDGVCAYLNMVFATGKGKRLSGGVSAAESFKGYAGTASYEDPTGGVDSLDDEISF